MAGFPKGQREQDSQLKTVHGVGAVGGVLNKTGEEGRDLLGPEISGTVVRRPQPGDPQGTAGLRSVREGSSQKCVDRPQHLKDPSFNTAHQGWGE